MVVKLYSTIPNNKTKKKVTMNNNNTGFHDMVNTNDSINRMHNSEFNSQLDSIFDDKIKNMDNNEILNQLQPLNDTTLVHGDMDFMQLSNSDIDFDGLFGGNFNQLEQQLPAHKNIPPNIIIKCQSECKKFENINKELKQKEKKLKELRDKKLNSAIKYISAMKYLKNFLSEYMSSRDEVEKVNDNINQIKPIHSIMAGEVSVLISQAEEYSRINDLLVEFAHPSVLLAIGKINQTEYKNILIQKRKSLELESEDLYSINQKQIPPSEVNAQNNGVINNKPTKKRKRKDRSNKTKKKNKQ